MAILWSFCLGLAKGNQIIIKATNLFEILAPIVYLKSQYGFDIIWYILYAR